MTKRKVYHQFPFTNDYVFSKVMRNPEYCKEILNRILPDKKVKEVTVLDSTDKDESKPSNEQTSTQVTLTQSVFSKGVRLDVLFEDDENIYNIEMQCAKEDDLPLRARYYSSQLDMELLPKGKKYTHLKNSYVIFICTFNPLGIDEAVSIFENYNVKKQLPLDDGRYIIFVNTKSEERPLSKDLQNLFEYINESSVDEQDIFLRNLESDIEALNHENEGWRDIMKLEEKFAWAREDAMEEGRKEGEKIGLAKGREEGRKQESTAIAKQMKSMNYDIGEISKITGLTVEEIEKL